MTLFLLAPFFLTAPAVVSAGGEGERSETELPAETTAEG